MTDTEWQPISTAPRDGTNIRAKIPGHGSDCLIAWLDDLMDENEKPCGGWHWMDDREPPECWSEGVCWESNAEHIRSVHPTEWKPIS